MCARVGGELCHQVVRIVTFLGLAQAGNAQVLFTVHECKVLQSVFGKPLVNDLPEAGPNLICSLSSNVMKNLLQDFSFPFQESAEFSKLYNLIICLLLFLLTTLVYWQVHDFDFITIDDDLYVLNDYVRQGLTKDTISWAFSLGQKDGTYWHPLTWLSHMLDVQLFGLDAGKHHIINIFYHQINSILLFFLLVRMSKARWKSALVAFLFALHPVNVESVAWIAERKNLLCTMFFLLTLYSYVVYCEKSFSLRRYLLIVAFFCLGLLAKAAIVPLPIVLLLFDYWPLDRIRPKKSFQEYRLRQKDIWLPRRALYLEKIPLLCLSIISVAITIYSQSDGQINTVAVSPLSLRISNAVVGPLHYIMKCIWPQSLQVFYPFPGSIALWQSLSVGLLLVTVTIIMVYKVPRYPQFLFGWLWFLIFLAPVSGIIQSGRWPAFANRWAYIPFIGLFIVLAWAGGVLMRRSRYNKNIFPALAVIILVFSTYTAWGQTGYWRDTRSLLNHEVELDPDNYFAHIHLGSLYYAEGDYESAARHFEKSVQKKSIMEINGRYHLGITLIRLGKADAAIKEFDRVLELNPASPEMLNRIGAVLEEQRRFSEAYRFYQAALRRDPGNKVINQGLGVILWEMGRTGEAVGYFEKALREDPSYRLARLNLGELLASQGEYERAQEQFGILIRQDPKQAQPYISIGHILLRLDRIDEAIDYYSKALERERGNIDALYGMRMALAISGQYDQINNFLTIKPPRDRNPDGKENGTRDAPVEGATK